MSTDWDTPPMRQEPQPTFRDPVAVFDEAIASGRLSDAPGTDNYASRWMYMGTWNGIDSFKHVETREYLK